MVAPVPLCLETVYFPTLLRASGFSYDPLPGFLFWASMDMVLSMEGSFLRIVKLLPSLALSLFSY